MLVSFHSYKGGTGKTNIVGNLGLLLAQEAQKTCIIDIDANGPGIHSLFNLEFENSLIEYLNNKCEIKDIVYKPETESELYLIPMKVWEDDITSLFKSPSEAKEKVLELIDHIKREYGFEHILFDCGPGINKSSFLIMNIVDKAIVVSTIDRQDIRGTYILTNMAKKLGSYPYLLFNKIPLDRLKEMDKVINEFSKRLETQLLEIIAFDKNVADTWSRRLVIDSAPNCAYCDQIHRIASEIVSD